MFSESVARVICAANRSTTPRFVSKFSQLNQIYCRKYIGQMSANS